MITCFIVSENGLLFNLRILYCLTALVKYNQEVNGKYASSSITTDSWIGKGGLNHSGVNINLIIGRQSCRSEIYINTGSKDENKRIFDFLYKYKDKIEEKMNTLSWERLDDKIVCRICVRKNLSFLSEEDQQDIFDFFLKSTDQFLDIFAPLMKQYRK